MKKLIFYTTVVMIELPLNSHLMYYENEKKKKLNLSRYKEYILNCD